GGGGAHVEDVEDRDPGLPQSAGDGAAGVEGVGSPPDVDAADRGGNVRPGHPGVGQGVADRLRPQVDEVLLRELAPRVGPDADDDDLFHHAAPVSFDPVDPVDPAGGTGRNLYVWRSTPSSST